MKKVIVTVAGQALSGSSSVVYFIEKLLNENGFKVEIDLEDCTDYRNLNEFNRIMKTNENERLTHIKENVEIILREKQLARNYFEQI